MSDLPGSASTPIAGGLGGLLSGNPVSTGLSLLSGLGGMFGKSEGPSSAAAYSGVGAFNPVNNNDMAIRKPPVDLGKPEHVIALALLLLLGVAAWKRIK